MSPPVVAEVFGVEQATLPGIVVKHIRWLAAVVVFNDWLAARVSDTSFVS